MYVVTVRFLIKPEFTAVFREHMLRNALASRTNETGCRQFDVAVAPDDPSHIFLYELYDDKAAFETHCATSHYRDFISSTAAWIVSKKAEFFQRIDPR